MARKATKKSRRKLVVFVSLLGALSLTSGLLLVLAPAPLTPDAAASLFAVDAPQSIDVIFDTHTPATPSRWRYIYVHQTGTPAGNALTVGEAGEGMGDHFLIGNGDGCFDGEIQVGQRWAQQKSAIAPRGVTHLEDSCVSIAIVGDFDRGLPTAAQSRRLSQLIVALQSRLRIPGNRVVLIAQSPGQTGVGKHFPTREFREQILP